MRRRPLVLAPLTEPFGAGLGGGMTMAVVLYVSPFKGLIALPDAVVYNSPWETRTEMRQ